MTLGASLATLAGLTALSALCSGMETGLYALDRVRLRIRAEEGDRRARRLLAAAARPSLAVASLLCANNVVNFFASGAASSALDAVLPDLDEAARRVVDVAALTPFLFIFGELAPKDAFLRAPARLMRRFEPALTAVRLLGLVVVAPVLAVAERFGRRSETEGPAPLDRASVGRLLTEAAEIAALSPAQRRLAESVLRLRQARVAERMTPLSAVVAVAPAASAADVARAGAAAGKSRLPVRAAGAPAFAGYVNVNDAAAVPPEEEDRPGFAGARLHDLPMIPAQAVIASALVRFQRRRKPLMQVVNKKGEATGLLAASDLVEALFEA